MKGSRCAKFGGVLSMLSGELRRRVTLYLAALKLFVAVMFAVFCFPAALSAQNSPFTLSGVFDASVQGGAGRDGFSLQSEAYANLRLQARIKDAAVFNAAFNLIATAGNPAAALPGTSFVTGENFSAALELERLSLRLNGEIADVDLGLMRLAFGYGQFFAPSDFLNPRNPLMPNARLRGILGITVLFYPTDESKVQVFAAAPRNPLSGDGSGYYAGLSTDYHWERASVQALYAFEAPKKARGALLAADAASSRAVHRAGLSVKADAVVGLLVDTMYIYTQGSRADIEGLSASAGIDYSFFDGTLYTAAEYLFSGSSSVTAASAENPFGFSHKHNVYALAQYAFTDFTSVLAACMLGLGDGDPSVTPVITLSHELFQGFTLSLTAQVPIREKRCFITLLGRLKL